MKEQKQIGKLNKKINIVLKIDEPSQDFYYQTNKTKIKTVWASIEPVGSAIYYGSQQVADGITHRFTIRYNKDLKIDSYTQIEYKKTVFNVKRLINWNECDKFLIIETEQITK